MESFLKNLYIGHWTDKENHTGCTVFVTPEGAVGGVDVRGAAPGTRETDLLRPGNLVERVHAVVLSGGSAFGLEAACGVMDCLADRGIGLDVGVARVPIVPSAVLFDLADGSSVFPKKEAGYAACAEALDGREPPAWGRVGAGAGATVGKSLGMEHCMKGGIGCSCAELPGGATVLAFAAVNALGDVLDENGSILAGARKEDGSFADTQRLLMDGWLSRPLAGTNTTLGLVVTDAAMDKAQANRLASLAHDGYARSIRPVHTQNDGDTIFALSCGVKQVDFMTLCAAAAEAMAEAVRKAVTEGDRS